CPASTRPVRVSPQAPGTWREQMEPASELRSYATDDRRARPPARQDVAGWSPECAFPPTDDREAARRCSMVRQAALHDPHQGHQPLAAPVSPPLPLALPPLSAGAAAAHP